MAFPLKDIRFTVRRSGGEMVIYPRVIRDRSFLPKVDIAIQYFETMLGQERREFQTEVLVHFFGDHKLARCMVGSLARSYRFRSPALAEVVTKAAWRRLERAGIGSPVGLRFALFDQLNDFGHGFLRPVERQETLAGLESRFQLRAGELERLLFLDAEEHARLGRVGVEPRAEDVVAQYNFGVLESLLRHAELIELRLARPSASVRGAVDRLLADYGIEAGREGADGLRLTGRQDAMGAWARHGRRVARAVVDLLLRDRSLVVGGEVRLALKDRRVTLRLTGELLDLLSGPASAGGGWGETGWSQPELAELAQALRAGGLSVRRWPEPRAWAAGVVLPDLLVGTAGQRWLLCGVRSAADGERLAPIAQAAATGEPLLFVGEAAALAPLAGVGAPVASVSDWQPEMMVAGLRAALVPAAEGLARAS